MMGRPRRQLTREEYKLLVAIKMESAYKAFSLSQLLSKLSTIGIGFWREANFIPFLVQYGVLSKNIHKQYVFDKAFNFEQLQLAVHKYQCHKSKNRKKKPIIVAVPIDPIADAIKLLKENGYRVQAKFFDLEEALKNPSSKVEDFVKWTEC